MKYKSQIHSIEGKTITKIFFDIIFPIRQKIAETYLLDDLRYFNKKPKNNARISIANNIIHILYKEITDKHE